MGETYHEESAEVFRELISSVSNSVGEMQTLKAAILKNDLFPDPEEKAEVLLLIDEIIWEETNGADKLRRERKRHLLAITELRNSIQ